MHPAYGVQPDPSILEILQAEQDAGGGAILNCCKGAGFWVVGGKWETHPGSRDRGEIWDGGSGCGGRVAQVQTNKMNRNQKILDEKPVTQHCHIQKGCPPQSFQDGGTQCCLFPLVGSNLH